LSLAEPQLHTTIALIQAVARVDTLVAIVAPPSGWQFWVQMLTSLATIVIALAMIAIALTAVVAIVRLRSIQGKMLGVAQRMQGDVHTLVGQAREMAAKVNSVTNAVRGDVEEFKASLIGVQGRLTRASDAAEERLKEFNALLRVAQEEAEDIFIGTASTIRGVRAGVDSLQGEEADPAWVGELEDEDLAEPDDRPRRNQ
jgi:hypothetical protein